MRSLRTPLALGAAVVPALPAAAHAYVGPGAGLSMVGDFVVLAVVVVVIVLGLLLYPILALRRRAKRRSR